MTMIGLIKDYWQIFGIVSAVAIFFFRFCIRLDQVFKAVKNQHKNRTDIDQLSKRLASQEQLSTTQARDIQRLEEINREQWREIGILESRIFKLSGNRK